MAAESSSSSNATSLPRNQACSNCRYRKIRCDAVRPVCGQCLYPDDCEYTENRGRSRVDILEEDIRRVQNRIRQLEKPEIHNSSVNPRHPYAQNPAQNFGLHQLLETPGFISTPPLSGPPSMFVNPSTSSPPSWRNSNRDEPVMHPQNSVSLLPGPPDMFIQSPTTSPDPGRNADHDEPPMHVVESLINVFLLSDADSWGFFLNTASFRQEALLPLPLGHHSRPSPALLATVYLVGASLSGTTNEEAFLARALSTLAISLSGLHPRRTLHVLQAHVILANYFFADRRFLQGKYHTAAAVSLALGSGLHNILPTSTEEDELLDACLATFTLDKTWAAALGVQSNWSGIPRLLEQVEHSTDGTKPPSPKTLLAKAAMLWDQANSLAVRWRPDMSIQELRGFSSTHDELGERLEAFRHALVLVSTQSYGTDLLTHSIAHVAAIQLHTPFILLNEQSKQKRLDASAAVLRALENATSHSAHIHINPILAPIWGAAFGAVLDEIPIVGPRDMELVGLFARGFAAMRVFSESCLLMDFHTEKIQDDASNLNIPC